MFSIQYKLNEVVARADCAPDFEKFLFCFVVNGTRNEKVSKIIKNKLATELKIFV